jgi:hypothetical protein
LAQLRDPRCKEDKETIAQALYGTWREEHLFALAQALAAYRFCHQQVAPLGGRLWQRAVLPGWPVLNQTNPDSAAQSGHDYQGKDSA